MFLGKASTSIHKSKLEPKKAPVNTLFYTLMYLKKLGGKTFIVFCTNITVNLQEKTKMYKNKTEIQKLNSVFWLNKFNLENICASSCIKIFNYHLLLFILIESEKKITLIWWKCLNRTVDSLQFSLDQNENICSVSTSRLAWPSRRLNQQLNWARSEAEQQLPEKLQTLRSVP